jgi:glycosyltransferase involved in cell wall biosynthesis
MTKIKVLHIITRLDKGGSAQNTLFTVIKLNKERFCAMLMSGLIRDKEILDLLSKEKIDYICIPALIRKISIIKDIMAFFRIYSFIKKIGFDIVHTHTSKAGIIGRWAAKLAGVRIIVHTPHGHIFYGYFGWLKTKLFIFLEKITASITDRIITLTQRGKEEHVKYEIAKENKFVPIYSGIQIKDFTGFKIDKIKKKQDLNVSLDVPVIGTVTRLDPVKGNKYFVDSLIEVTKVFPALKVFIIGEGSESKELKQHVKLLGLCENIIFIGLCPDIRGILSILDIMVLSSLNEGMGRSLLEAQALGIPVITTKVGGIPEIVKDKVTGILVPPGDSKAMAEAIINLLKDKSLREKMGEEAKKWVDERFSIDTMVEKITDLYEKLKCL